MDYIRKNDFKRSSGGKESRVLQRKKKRRDRGCHRRLLTPRGKIQKEKFSFSRREKNRLRRKGGKEETIIPTSEFSFNILEGKEKKRNIFKEEVLRQRGLKTKVSYRGGKRVRGVCPLRNTPCLNFVRKGGEEPLPPKEKNLAPKDSTPPPAS